MAVDSADRRDVIVKIDGEDNGETMGKIWRDGSYDFWTDGEGNLHKNLINAGGGEASERSGSTTSTTEDRGNNNDEGFEFRHGEDPPTKLIGQFLHKQQASGEISLDMDLSMEELQSKGLTPVLESPASTKAPVVRRDSRGGGGGGNNDDGEVVKCSGNAPIQRNLLKMRTKSRLSDPPTPNPNPQVPEMMKSGRVAPKSGQLKSGFFGKTPKSGGGEEVSDKEAMRRKKGREGGFIMERSESGRRTGTAWRRRVETKRCI